MNEQLPPAEDPEPPTIIAREAEITLLIPPPIKELLIRIPVVPIELLKPPPIK